MPKRGIIYLERLMRTTIKLPDSVYQQSERIARLKGYSVEQFVVHTLERALEAEPTISRSSTLIKFPLISSSRPGTLDLTTFDFDDLLA
jgi:hypothetical protein